MMRQGSRDGQMPCRGTGANFDRLGLDASIRPKRAQSEGRVPSQVSPSVAYWTHAGENHMTRLSIAIVAATMLSAPFVANAQDVPDAVSVEWQGKKPCEKLYEDDQIRILRCSLPPGAKHVRHQHPTNFGYILNGAKLLAQNANGMQPQQELETDSIVVSPPVPWHEVTNVGDSTLRVVVVEMKYKSKL